MKSCAGMLRKTTTDEAISAPAAAKGNTCGLSSGSKQARASGHLQDDFKSNEGLGTKATGARVDDQVSGYRRSLDRGRMTSAQVRILLTGIKRALSMMISAIEQALKDLNE